MSAAAQASRKNGRAVGTMIANVTLQAADDVSHVDTSLRLVVSRLRMHEFDITHAGLVPLSRLTA